MGIVDLAVASFGQRFNVTPLQMVTGFSAVINGGNLYQPYVVQKVTDSEGNTVKENSSTLVRQVVSEQTSQRARGHPGDRRLRGRRQQRLSGGLPHRR